MPRPHALPATWRRVLCTRPTAAHARSLLPKRVAAAGQCARTLTDSVTIAWFSQRCRVPVKELLFNTDAKHCAPIPRNVGHRRCVAFAFFGQ
mmetsp:Transcript_22366/g.51494  ORF Transcript_22366/g.51494 Transcript_22366/m.51494 type:complete len:92 (-) Transcript_22366:1091-1366(-)